MKPFPRSRLSSVSFLLVMGLASSGCVKPNLASVGMSKVEASLVFGVKDIPKAIPSPIEEAAAQLAVAPVAVEQVRPVQQQQQVAAPDEPEPSFEFAKPSIPRFATPSPTAAAEECPEASVSAAPLLAPQPRVTADPRLGTSNWREGGFITLTLPDGKQTLPSREVFGTRAIRNFKRLSPDIYTFEEVSRPLFGGDAVRVSTYKVNNNPVQRNPSDGVGNVSTPTLGEPERGISLVREELVNARTGQATGPVFAPTTGLLMLPIPVVSGVTFTSTAVDPKTGETRTHSAKVLERQRIDACGDLVDGWGVTYDRRFGGNAADSAFAQAGSSVAFTSVFATQYGGVPIFEKVTLTKDQCNFCPFESKQRLGQLTPTPPTTAP